MAAADLINACLPDELLLLVFSSLPCLTARLVDGAVTLGSLVAAERTCRRWRRLALGLTRVREHPMSVRCGHCEAWSPGSAIAGEITHCLIVRKPAVLEVHLLSVAVAAVLVSLRLPAVRRLAIQRAGEQGASAALLRSLPHTFPALEELHTDYWADYGEAYLASVRLLPGLKAVDVCVPDITSGVIPALLALPLLQSVRLELLSTNNSEQPMGPLPPGAAQLLGQLGSRLRHLSLDLQSPCVHVTPELFLLPSTLKLDISINFEEHEDELAGLLRLPSVQQLCIFGYDEQPYQPLPGSCWAGSHLTKLNLDGCVIDVPAGTAASLSTLRRLELCRVAFSRGGFPAELCLLHQLASLTLFDLVLGDPCLPSDLSKLSNLRELSIWEPSEPLDSEGLSVLRTLTTLTHLELTQCRMQDFPAEPMYPASLEQLTIRQPDPNVVCSLMSPTRFGSPTLQRLHMAMPSACVTEQAHWQRLAAALIGHRSLQELFDHLRKEGWGRMRLREEQVVWRQLQQAMAAAGVTVALRHLPLALWE